MKNKIMNLLSRKFILTMIATIIGIATMAANTDNVKVQIAGLVVILIAQVVYNIIEGTIDAKSMITLSAQTLTTISELLKASNNTTVVSTTSPTITDVQKVLEAVKKATEASEANQ